MKISGLQKMTLLDFPGKVACTVFLQGCNFRCPFCHNSGLLDAGAPGEITKEALLDFLKKRKGLLDGVCITGGEPTVQPELPQLLQQIKALGYSIKLDTNGTHPDILKELVTSGLVDYVAMDIKNCPRRYAETVGLPKSPLDKIEQSIRFLMNGTLPFEFRTTVVEEFHDDTAIAEMVQWLQALVPDKKLDHYFLQPFVDRDSVLQTGLHTPKAEILQRFSQILTASAENVCIRGADA